MRDAVTLGAATLSAAMLLWSFGGGMAMPGGATGLVQKVAGHAFVVEGWRRTILAAGAQLHVGDTLQAGRDGPFQITFAGDVILTLAAGARLTLSRSVFDKYGKAHGIAALLSDAARGITGAVQHSDIPKDKALVPEPSIGVRG